MPSPDKKKTTDVVQPAIGIDLGTTHCCIGVFQDGEVDIIANEHGHRTTPSYVAFVNGQTVVGEAAKREASRHPDKVVFDSKRLIGRNYSDDTVKADIANWPFKVIDKGGKPTIEVIDSDGGVEKKCYTPEGISAIILRKLKLMAEVYVGVKVRDVVITVPAHFTDSQRQATKDAAEIAEMNVLNLLNEPTAAAVAYRLQRNRKVNAEQNILVYDLGGGTLDVSVLKISPTEKIEVQGTAGDTHLGGEDFDARLVKFCVKEIKDKCKIDLSTKPRALARLRASCEEAKKVLSFNTVASFYVDMVKDESEYKVEFTRDHFNSLCDDLFRKTLASVEKALVAAEIGREFIDDVVLVGGSSRIHRVQEILREFFKKSSIKFGVNPDEAIAHGATFMAAVITGQNKIMRDIVLMEVTPLGLGIETGIEVKKMSIIVRRNTRIPCSRTQEYMTMVDNQTRISVKVYEGDRADPSENKLLGKFSIAVPPAPKGKSRINVTFTINEDGILKVTAFCQTTNKSVQVTITTNRNTLSRFDVQQMKEEIGRL